MNEITLLQQYVKTLQSENQAKNNQRETLYQQLDQFTAENFKLLNEINYLKQIFMKNQNCQQIIVQLQQQNLFFRQEIDNLVKILQERDAQISNFKYQQDKDSQRIKNLEDINKQVKKNQAKLKQQLSQIKSEYRMAKERLQELEIEQNSSKQESREQKINQLFQNYEQIEKLFCEKNAQNQVINKINEKLNLQLQQLKNQLFAKQNQIRALKKNYTQKEQKLSIHNIQNENNRYLSNVSKEKQTFQKDEPFLTNISLVRQNILLIQRVTELEKQKNLLYETLKKQYHIQDSSQTLTRSPLKELNSITYMRSHQDNSRLRAKIQQVKHENEMLLQHLTI